VLGFALGFASSALHVVPLPDDRRWAPGSPARDRAVGFFSRDNLPWPLAGVDRWGISAFAAIDGGRPCDFGSPHRLASEA
jgi:hypothetical protein